MSRSWKLFLQDIIDSGSKVIRHTEQVSYEEFVSNEILYDAVIRNLEIIGEAAKKIPEDIRRQYPEVDWRAVAGLRDVLAHAYFSIDNETLWDVIVNKLPTLLNIAQRIQKEQ
jgi:uncharacterized protein with HEPN domain